MYQNNDLGIQFLYPPNWSVYPMFNGDCNPYALSVVKCVEVVNNDGEKLRIKIEPYFDPEIDGSLLDSDIKDSKVINVGSLFNLIVPGHVNSLFRHNNQDLIEMYHVVELYSPPRDYDFMISYGKALQWLFKQDKGYTFQMLLITNYHGTRNSISDLESVEYMGTILSTLKIDFEKNVFE